MVARRCDGTGIEDADICVRFYQYMPARLCQLCQRLCFKLIDLAAQCCKAKFHKNASDTIL